MAPSRPTTTTINLFIARPPPRKDSPKAAQRTLLVLTTVAPAGGGVNLSTGRRTALLVANRCLFLNVELDRVGRRLGTSPDLQLPVNVLQVRLDRPFAQAEPARDGLVARALDHHQEDLSFAFGERFGTGQEGYLEALPKVIG